MTSQPRVAIVAKNMNATVLIQGVVAAIFGPFLSAVCYVRQDMAATAMFVTNKL